MTDEDRHHLTLLVIVWGLVALAYMLNHGCGASGAYRIEEERCERAEAVVVAREGTSAAEDAEDMAWERARCDEALRVILGSP